MHDTVEGLHVVERRRQRRGQQQPNELGTRLAKMRKADTTRVQGRKAAPTGEESAGTQQVLLTRSVQGTAPTDEESAKMQHSY